MRFCQILHASKSPFFFWVRKTKGTHFLAIENVEGVGMGAKQMSLVTGAKQMSLGEVDGTEGQFPLMGLLMQEGEELGIGNRRAEHRWRSLAGNRRQRGGGLENLGKTSEGLLTQLPGLDRKSGGGGHRPPPCGCDGRPPTTLVDLLGEKT